jgi:hypothetical protein
VCKALDLILNIAKKKKKKEKQVTLIPVIFYLTPYIKK